MTRFFSALAAITATASLVAVHAAAANGAPPVRTIASDAEGRPLLLKRMVATATALPYDAAR